MAELNWGSIWYRPCARDHLYTATWNQHFSNKAGIAAVSFCVLLFLGVGGKRLNDQTIKKIFFKNQLLKTEQLEQIIQEQPSACNLAETVCHLGIMPKYTPGLGCVFLLGPLFGAAHNTASWAFSGSLSSRRGEAGQPGWAALSPCFYFRARLLSLQGTVPLLSKGNWRKARVDVTFIWLSDQWHSERPERGMLN